MTAVKICGVCRPVDAALVAELRADYLGVILAPDRARSRSPTEAQAIYAAAPAIARVGVFVDAPVGAVLTLRDRLQLDVVQLHGQESPADVEQLAVHGATVWKAVRVRTRADVEHALAGYGGLVDALLLDGWSAHAAGGAGIGFSWSEIAPLRRDWPAGLQLVVAGGLNPDNVAAAIAALQPAVVDVSSGVEAEVGVKAPDRLAQFLSAARGTALSSGVLHD